MAPGDARIPAEAGGRRTADGTDLGDRAIWDSPRAAPGRMDRGRRPGCPDAAHVRSSRLGEGRMPGPASTGGRASKGAGGSPGNHPAETAPDRRPEAEGQPSASSRSAATGRSDRRERAARLEPGRRQRLPNTGRRSNLASRSLRASTACSCRVRGMPETSRVEWTDTRNLRLPAPGGGNQPSHGSAVGRIADFYRERARGRQDTRAWRNCRRLAGLWRPLNSGSTPGRDARAGGRRSDGREGVEPVCRRELRWERRGAH